METVLSLEAADEAHPFGDLPAPSAARPVRRSLWWTVHHWLGLKVSLLMTVILLTGSFAVLAYEIDWLIFPAMRVQPLDRPYASWGAWAAGVRAAEPKSDIVSLAYPLEPWYAARAMVVRRDGETVYLEIDPWTARVRGATPWVNAHRILRELHRHLFLPLNVGVPLVGGFGVILLGSMVTGLVAYKKFWRGFLRVPRWRRGRTGELRKFVGDLHRFTALWSLWFVLLVGATGTWYLVESLGADAPPLPAPTAGTAGWDARGGQLDQAIAVAERAHPGLRIRNIQFPYEGDPGLIVEGQAEAILVRDRANAVYIDPESLKVLMATRGQQLNAHQRISEAADPLHFGTWGGFTTKLIWFVFGLMLSSLSITGAMIYATRLKKAEAAREPSRRRDPLLLVWDGMGPFAYVIAAFLILAACYAPQAVAG